MKKRLVMIIAACFIAVSFASAQGIDIRGTWRVLNIDGKQVPHGYSFLKMYTATHFMWTLSDKDGNVIGGAGGTYTIDGNTLRETIDKVLPMLKESFGKTQTSKLSGGAGRLTVDTDTDNDDEIWEKID